MILIGERINATRKSIREAIVQRDEERIRADIARQDAAGAHYIDLNAGTGKGDPDQETRDLCWLVDLALEQTEKPLALDSAAPSVIRAAAEHLAGRRPWMLNSVKCDDDILESGLSLAAQHKVPLIALVMDKDGIPPTPQRRIEVAAEIHKAAQAKGVGEEQLFFDPLAMPIAADISQTMITLQTLRLIKQRFPKAKTTVGLSNVSHGLTKRSEVNGAFLIAALSNGLDSAICDPSIRSVKRAVVLGELVTGSDRHCRRFARAVRSGLFETAAPAPAGEAATR